MVSTKGKKVKFIKSDKKDPARLAKALAAFVGEERLWAELTMIAVKNGMSLQIGKAKGDNSWHRRPPQYRLMSIGRRRRRPARPVMEALKIVGVRGYMRLIEQLRKMGVIDDQGNVIDIE